MIADLAHFEINGPDDGALVDFYVGLLGWPTDPTGPGYTLIQSPGGLRGAIVESPESRVTLGVAVDDLGLALEQVIALGGKILIPATDNGWVEKALIADPAGNVMSLIQDRPSGGR
ncbi:MAG TPA: VOC family protein [Candidatus Acidoferrum sp.]|nr:VOC family protein [Candidatus Acidoferrum sp.]